MSGRPWRPGQPVCGEPQPPLQQPVTLSLPGVRENIQAAVDQLEHQYQPGTLRELVAKKLNEALSQLEFCQPK